MLVVAGCSTTQAPTETTATDQTSQTDVAASANEPIAAKIGLCDGGGNKSGATARVFGGGTSLGSSTGLGSGSRSAKRSSDFGTCAAKPKSQAKPLQLKTATTQPKSPTKKPFIEQATIEPGQTQNPEDEEYPTY